MFRYRRHEDEIIVLAVRCYIPYRLSLRDLTEMLDERGLRVSPSTIWRWVQRYVPEFEKRGDMIRRRTGSSWRVDETYVKIRANGSTSTELSTSKGVRSIFCYGRTAVLQLPRRSSGRP